ncbi:MAG: alpha/beta hydrolase [Betaproteobacteria bacterium]|nr:MAG: alpha/beta hydrolase [Betaproteobacteria bacterium]
MREHHVSCLNSRGFHRLHYTDWGDPANPRAVICVHGLTRNCRDFDALAAALQNELRVVCVSIAGRGRSDWLPNAEDYGYPQYMADMTALIARITATGARDLAWVGTSMGGMLGMLLAARPNTPLQRLVLNDVGTVIPKASMARIGTYVGKDPRFNSFAEAEQYVRIVSAPFGPLTDRQWRHLTEHNTRQFDDGRWGMNYDPAIALPFRKVADRDIVLWPAYDALRCPTLLLRGAESDLLLHDTALEMTQRGPRPRLIEFAGVGHAPALMADDQIAAIRDFLLAA